MDQSGVLPGAKCVCAVQPMQHSHSSCVHIRICAMVLLEYGEMSVCMSVCLSASLSHCKSVDLLTVTQVVNCVMRSNLCVLMHTHNVKHDHFWHSHSNNLRYASCWS